MTTAPTLQFDEFAAWLRANADAHQEDEILCPVDIWIRNTQGYPRALTYSEYWLTEVSGESIALPDEFQRFIAVIDAGASALDALAEAER